MFDATIEMVEFAFTFMVPFTVSESHIIPGVVRVYVYEPGVTAFDGVPEILKVPGEVAIRGSLMSILFDD